MIVYRGLIKNRKEESEEGSRYFMDEVGIVMDLEEKQTFFLMSLALNFRH